MLQQQLRPDFALDYCISASLDDEAVIAEALKKHENKTTAQVRVIHSNPLDCVTKNVDYYMFLN